MQTNVYNVENIFSKPPTNILVDHSCTNIQFLKTNVSFCRPNNSQEGRWIGNPVRSQLQIFRLKKINMVHRSLLKGFNTYSELKTLFEMFLKILSSLKHFPSIFCPYRLQLLLSHSNKYITENNPAFLLQSSLNLTLIQILLRNMRLSNFKLSSVLSFADKPKLTYLTRPIKNKKNAQIVCKN